MSESPAATLAVAPVKFEHLSDGLGIGHARPRLSWITTTVTPDWRQHAYELQLMAADGAPGESVAVQSDASVLVPWPFAGLASRESVGVRVRVAGSDAPSGWSPWSEAAWAETGLLAEGDWTARFITPDWDDDTTRDNPCPVLRRRFDIRTPVRSARLYASALGVYEAELNGKKVSDTVLAPGWTPYGKRLKYQTYDVTDLLAVGSNELTATLADGWYRGRLGFEGKRALYGERLALLAQLEVTYDDGTVLVVDTSDGTGWQAAPGPVLRASLYDGETCDARITPDSWHGVRTEPYDLALLTAPTGPPVRPTEELAPITVTASPSGKTILDFGQNLVGWMRITVDGDAGREVVLRHAEVLQDGELALEPLRTAEATDRYILRGGGPETWEPRFSFHGFRYAEIAGWPGDVDPDAVRAVVVHSDMTRTGSFSCSEHLVNRLHENAVWSMRGNFLDVPTDCPQRDERLGWTGDIQAFAPTACQLYDSAGFLTSWLQDLALEQGDDGTVPFIVPKAAASGSDLPTAAWGDAATIVPWTLYLRYGDAGVLDAQFDSMRAWVDKVAELAGPDLLWNSGFQFGDWLDPSAPPEQPQAGKTPPDVVATAYFARSAQIVADAATVLGRDKEALHYSDLAARVRTAFQDEYTTANGRVIPDAQTAYALALEFDLLPHPEQRARAADRLAALLRENGYRIGTGFVGTPLMCDALADHGHLDAAYRLLLQQECPSWLYPITQGATTIWERWDSLRPDGTLNPSGMTSFNHYALGAVVAWLYRTVAGLDAAEPGYRRLRIAPRPGGGLGHARADLHTPYGPASVSWHRDDDTLTIDAQVPPNTTAEVELPYGGTPFTVGSGQHTWTTAVPSETTRAPLTADTPMSEMLDHPEAMAVLRETLARHWPEAAAHMDTESTGSAGYAEVSPRQLAAFFAGGDAWLAELEGLLAAL
ncbi:alpha-L-rhamnosidase [Yinghuangia soli]|uniref:alpha-L-rhamnosidase n=1 Tax=Yinghuangia soli TaxID=2908204 RepID=A0AA41QB74_9ACTN|nr:alpha-L-rhamnosidase [Yinghuangia soli]MCF2533577.1 glycoside hydrolase family 78 protein [Yinghuangia soli]